MLKYFGGGTEIRTRTPGFKVPFATITTTALADHTPILISLHHQVLPRMDKPVQLRIPDNRNR